MVSVTSKTWLADKSLKGVVTLIQLEMQTDLRIITVVTAEYEAFEAIME